MSFGELNCGPGSVKSGNGSERGEEIENITGNGFSISLTVVLSTFLHYSEAAEMLATRVAAISLDSRKGRGTYQAFRSVYRGFWVCVDLQTF